MTTILYPSSIDRNKTYVVDTEDMTCTCKGFTFNKTCKHLSLAVEEVALHKKSSNNSSTESAEVSIKPASDKRQTKELKDYDAWTRTRLSKNFILRDFLYSSTSDYFGISNRPSESKDMVVKAGKELCKVLLEPILEKFGRFFITYGYHTREVRDALDPNLKPKGSCPHQWDRGTYGNEVYARVDIVPICVEDGEVTHEEFIKWVMYNTPCDLLMLWRGSNTFCLTISPRPRRVALEWVTGGKGENGSNRITYMGENFWNNVYPVLKDEEKPKFKPSATNGKMW